MGKGTKIWLIVAAVLVLVGCVTVGGVVVALGFDLGGLAADRLETFEHEIGEVPQGISIHTAEADVTVVPSTDGVCRVVCNEQKNVKHTVSVKDGVLLVEVVDTRKWYEHIVFGWGRSPSVTVQLPQGEHGALSVRTTTGDTAIAKDFCFASITVEGTTGDVTSAASATGDIRIETTTGDIHLTEGTAASLSLSVTTGKITATSVTVAGAVSAHVGTGDAVFLDVACESLSSTGSTGDLYLRGVVATGSLLLERSTGDIELEACDAAALKLETTTGDVEISLLSDKSFFAESTTGDIDIPRHTAGGRCEITTTTGDIEAVVK